MRLLNRSILSAENGVAHGAYPDDVFDQCRERRGTFHPHTIEEEAAELLSECFSPKRIHIIETGREDPRNPYRVKMVIIFKDGDLDQLWEDMTIALAEAGIDGDLTVLTQRMFDADRKLPFTVAYEAFRMGYVYGKA